MDVLFRLRDEDLLLSTTGWFCLILLGLRRRVREATNHILWPLPEVIFDRDALGRGVLEARE